jgi:hypothetical protein
VGQTDERQMRLCPLGTATESAAGAHFSVALSSASVRSTGSELELIENGCKAQGQK